jgi:hypothetical protein
MGMAVRDLNQAYADNAGVAAGKYEPTVQELADLRHVLTGGGNIGILPANVQPIAQRMRNKVDSLTREMVSSGAATGGLVITLTNNLGVYVTRTYKARTMGDRWAKEARADQQLMARASTELRSRIANHEARKAADALFMAQYGTTPNLFGIASQVISPQQLGMLRSTTQYQTLFQQSLAAVNVSPAAIESAIDEYLLGDPLERYANKRNVLAKNLSVFKRKDYFEDWELALMGEHTDPRQEFVATVMKQAALLEQQKAMAEMARDLSNLSPNASTMPGSALFVHENDFNQGNHTGSWVRVSSAGNPVFTPLDQFYVRRETMEDLQELFGTKPLGSYERHLAALTGVVKTNKTVYSLVTQVRNFASASLFVVSAGHFGQLRPDRVQGALSLMTRYGLAEQRGRLSATDQAFINDMVRLGVLNESVSANDISKALGESPDVVARLLGGVASGDPMTRAMRNKVQRWAIDKPQALYLFGDNVWKTLQYQGELDLIRRAYPAWSAEQQKVEAARRVRSTSPTYSLVSPFVQKLRRNPLFGPFVPFAFESTRSLINTYRTIRDDAMSGNAVLMRHAGKRAIGTTMALYGAKAAAMTAVSTASMLGFGGGDEEDERSEAAIRNLLPESYENAEIVTLGRVRPGVVRYINVSYLSPYSAAVEPMQVMVRHFTSGNWNEESFLDASTRALAHAAAPYTKFELVAPAIAEVITGRTTDDQEVYGPTDNWYVATEKSLAHLAKRWGPGVVEQVAKAFDPQRSAGVEVASMLSGLRVSELDVAYLAETHARRFKRTESSISGDLTRDMRNPYLSEQDLESMIEETNRRREVAFWDVHSKVSAAQHLLGLSDTQMRRLLKAGEAGEDASRQFVQGKWQPYRNTSALDEAIKMARTPEDKQGLRNVRSSLHRVLARTGKRELDLPIHRPSVTPLGGSLDSRATARKTVEDLRQQPSSVLVLIRSRIASMAARAAS